MKNKGSGLIFIGVLFLFASLCFAAYNVVDSIRAFSAANAALGELYPVVEEAENRNVTDRKEEEEKTAPVPAYIVDPEMDMAEVDIGGIDYIGILSIPALDVQLPIASEWSYENLKIAPCRYQGSVYLDDMCLCAHNYEDHFGRIKDLKAGDAVIFTDISGNTFYYEVRETLIVQPTDIDGMINSEWDLSMFTCTLDGLTRVTVRCERIK